MKHTDKFLKISAIVVIFVTAMIAFQSNFGNVMAQNETTANNANASQGNGTGQEFMQVRDVPAGNQTVNELTVTETGVVGNTENITSSNGTNIFGNISGVEPIPAEQAGQEIAELPLYEK